MVKQNQNDQIVGENQTIYKLEHIASNKILDKEGLEEVSGAGLVSAFTGWHAAADFEGNSIAKVNTSLYGLVQGGKGRYDRTEDYAYKQAEKHRSKDAVRTY